MKLNKQELQLLINVVGQVNVPLVSDASKSLSSLIMKLQEMLKEDKGVESLITKE